ncbi:hypothetical protein [Streptomyces albidoflavus]|uniref:hypothetical protein n=1 Tax=Streptomyces albidoflavus TaxID=1886 RepID=UPI00102229CD|nr:hypothetical protein [Streptomyces albidoflavus]RZF02842.1 hypothetical protein C0R05_32010 [Streptomyces albidoflavus]
MTITPSPRPLTDLEQEVTSFLRQELARQGVPNPEQFSVVWEWAAPVDHETVPGRDDIARRFARALGLPAHLLPTQPKSD